MVLNCGNRMMNTYLYSIREGYVMIDTGYEKSLKMVQKNLDKNHISFNDVKYVFLTHAHDDHVGFLKELLIKYPHIKVICHPLAIEVLINGENSFDGYCTGFLAYAYCRLLALFGKKNNKFPKIDDFLLDRFMIIDKPHQAYIEYLIQGKILFTPGHTRDSISLKVGDEIFCGDACMNGIPSIKRMTIWVEDRIQLKSSWNKLIEEKPRIINPGHGKPFGYEDLVKYKDYIDDIKIYKLK